MELLTTGDSLDTARRTCYAINVGGDCNAKHLNGKSKNTRTLYGTEAAIAGDLSEGRY